MPELSLPEVKLPKLKLPAGLRDMTRDDIQKAVADIERPKVEISTSDLQKQADRMAENAGKLAEDVGRNAAKLAEDVGRNAGKLAEDVGRNVERALPRRSGPSPVPFAVLGMLGGLVVGWILATSPTMRPRITGFVDWLRGRIDAWRTGGISEIEEDLEMAGDELKGYDMSSYSRDYAASGSTTTMHSGTGTEELAGSGTGDRPDDLRGQSLGAAAADDLPPTDDDVVPEAVVVDEVIVVAPSTGSPGEATSDDVRIQDDGKAEGTGRMTDQMQIDDTEGDDEPGTGRV